MAKESQKDTSTKYIVGDDKRFQFEVKYTSPTGQQYQGTFVSKIPSVKDLLMVGQKEAEQFSGVQNIEALSITTQNIAYMVATLQTCLVKWPGWFDVNNIDDINILEGVYREHSQAVDQFRQECTIEIKSRNQK